jgi:hypothetical protein
MTTRTSHENELIDAASQADYRHEWEEYLEQVRDRVAMIVAAASAAGIDLEGEGIRVLPVLEQEHAHAYSDADGDEPGDAEPPR